MRNVCAIQPCLLPSWRALITRSRKSTEYPLMPSSLHSSPSYFSSVYLRTAVGVADYGVCQASTEPQLMYPGNRLTGNVKGYDEENQWIVLESPRVHQGPKSNT